MSRFPFFLLSILTLILIISCGGDDAGTSVAPTPTPPPLLLDLKFRYTNNAIGGVGVEKSITEDEWIDCTVEPAYASLLRAIGLKKSLNIAYGISMQHCSKCIYNIICEAGKTISINVNSNYSGSTRPSGTTFPGLGTTDTFVCPTNGLYSGALTDFEDGGVHNKITVSNGTLTDTEVVICP